ncbi:hypothetical protein CEXT_232171 [Caerostris extrusa]|uniref:MADF domain-containing protein n=1 Tax=Caerostris extrusa TaxID=172846 RepID=A0AAV4NWV2_CAEEX|nr:hypothetical protein CEXT_232171 [Caerostris extrusa]
MEVVQVGKCFQVVPKPLVYSKGGASSFHFSLRQTSKPKLDELKLIQLIKERPALYDSGHPKHRYRLHIDQLWNEIAVEMGAPVYDLRNKWHVLRCCFNRAMKEMQSGNRRSGRQWHLYNAMLFIKSYLRKRKIDDQSATENSHSLKQELLQGQDSVIDNDDLECDVSPPKQAPPPPSTT